MKKNYSKPQIIVEAFTMDQPVARDCVAKYEDIESLIAMGLFGEQDIGTVKKCGMIYDEAMWGNDTVCYHSNVNRAFLS